MKLIHWDCLEEMKKIETESIDLCITDCPYKIIAWWVRIVDLWDECSWVLAKRDYSKTDPKWCLNRWKIVVSDWTNCSNKWLKKNNTNIPSAVKNWKMFNHNDIQFKDWLPELFRIMKNWTHTYIMINWRNLKDLHVEAEKVWFKYQNLLVWDKWNLTPNKYYMQWAEFILMLRKWPAKNINNLWSSNILRIKNIIWKKVHPTEKPVNLIEIMVANSSNEWDLVLDPFMWSWSTWVACKNLNRDFIWIELDEKYFEIAKARINNNL